MAAPRGVNVPVNLDWFIERKVTMRAPKPRTVTLARNIIHGSKADTKQKTYCMLQWAVGNPRLLLEVAKAVKADKDEKKNKEARLKATAKRSRMTPAQRRMLADKEKVRRQERKAKMAKQQRQ